MKSRDTFVPCFNALDHLAKGRILVLAILLIPIQIPSCLSAEKSTRGGKVILVRGVLTVFSLGLDDLSAQLVERGYSTEVVPASLAYLAVDSACKKYAMGELNDPLILIGHSLGGDLLPGLAERLATDHREVDLLIMIDSTFPSNCPPNVRRCVNLYQTNFSPEWFRIFRGAPIQSLNSATELINIDVRKAIDHHEAAKLNHFNIEASPWIHKIVIDEVDTAMCLASERRVNAHVHTREILTRTRRVQPDRPAARIPVGF